MSNRRIYLTAAAVFVVTLVTTWTLFSYLISEVDKAEQELE